MTLRLNPYLAFRGEAAEAMAFYESIFGGELAVTQFGEIPMPGLSETDTGKVMHAMLIVADGLCLMAADIPAGVDDGSITSNHPISLSGDDAATLQAWWDGLSEGATVDVPLFPAPWGDTFGQLTDRFGVRWLVNIAPTP